MMVNLWTWMKEPIYCGVDIGNHTIKCGLYKAPKGRPLSVFVQKQVKTQGLLDSQVVNLAELSTAIGRVILETTQEARVNVHRVHCALSAGCILLRRSKAAIPLIDVGHRMVVMRDKKNLDAQAGVLAAKMDEDILHFLPQAYFLDDKEVSLSPSGLTGKKLGVQALVLMVPSPVAYDLTKAVNEAGYDVASLAFSSYAVSCGFVNDTLRQQGVLVLDIGAQATSMLFFQGGQLRRVEKISIGGRNITEAIQQKLKVTFELAEEIKKTALNVAEDEQEDESLLVKDASGYHPVQKKIILEAAEPVVRNLAKALNTRLRHAQMREELIHGMVLMGGGSLLSGLAERLGEATRMSSRLVRQEHEKKNESLGEMPFMATQGLIEYHLRHVKKRQNESLSDVNRWFAMVQKTKELYQEYF